jgi:hypothetical protein
MEEVKQNGGAIIGGVRILWPFATLIVDKNKLQLNGSIYCTLVFRPADIIAIEPCGNFLNAGIQVHHTVPGYNPHIIFLTGKSEELMDKIQQTGFLDNRSSLPGEVEAEFADIQENGAFPLKISVSIIILLVWNILILGNRFLLPGQYDDDIPFTGLEAAFFFTLIIAILLLIGKPFRELIIKRGRKIETFKSFVYLTICISIVMIVVLIFFPKQ